jgi:histidine ammonia-lyase
MGMTAALKLRLLVANVAAILGLVLLAACQALDLLAPLRSGVLVEKARGLLRQAVTELTFDRPLHGDIARVGEMVRNGEFSKFLR